MKNSIFITIFFISGVIAGNYLNIPDVELVKSLMTWSLYALMLFVGLSFGSDPKLNEILGKLNIRQLTLPLMTVLGTYLGISIYVLGFKNITPVDAYAVASGFGYYSLSSIIISEFSGAGIAVIALLSNVMREILTLLLTPLMRKYFGKTAPICSAGATSMDTTLPVIVKSSGKDYLLSSLVHGIILTILVPVLITFIYKVF